jgi:hypothetical protein
VWSVGDVTGAGAFTHVAMYQARIAASDILGQAHEPASYRALPRVTFTDPEVGAVGLTEAQARGTEVSVRTAVSPIPSSSRGWIHGPGNDGFIKLIADADAGMLIGSHLCRASWRRGARCARGRGPRPGPGRRAEPDDLRAPRGALLYSPRSGHGLEEVSLDLMADP